VALWNGAFGEVYYIGEVIRQVTPLILAGLSVAFAFRTGLFNIGVEGQLIVGWLAAVWVGIAFDLPPGIHALVAVLAAAVAGALWAFIPGLLKAKFRVHEVIVTIMLNYTALHVTNYLIRTVLSERSDRTEMIKDSATLRSPFLEGLTDYSRLHWGIIIALIAVFIMWFLLEKTTRGYELRAVGFNQHASHYAGMNVDTNIILSMVISGAFAGLAGAMEGLGTFGYASIKGGFTGVGFDGIAVALLGANGPIGVILAALLFGALKVGALNMPLEAGVPNELVDIIIALIVFFVAASYMIRLFIDRISKKGVK
jgi:simple sugar transport system permease protein